MNKEFYYCYVSLYTYNEFLKENNNSNRINKFSKIQCHKGIPKYLVLDEIFETDKINLNFTLQEIDHPKFLGYTNSIYRFKTKKSNEYRIDFVFLKEDNKNLKDNRLHNRYFISIGFSPNNATIDTYDELTKKREEFEVLTNVIYILKEYKKNHSNDIFMFGDPNEQKKLDIYQYIIEKCFSEYKLIIDYTSGFNKTNIGYYLIKE